MPFRLTQNIIDGFGMNGIDGVFRRCAEETLRVLRERSDVILMILEVFKHDPLQQWSVSHILQSFVSATDFACAGPCHPKWRNMRKVQTTEERLT